MEGPCHKVVFTGTVIIFAAGHVMSCDPLVGVYFRGQQISSGCGKK